jgi:hypothetical protein
MLSHGAVIDRDRLIQRLLTTKDALSPEDQKFKDHPWFKSPSCEADRLRLTQQRLKSNLNVIDLRDDSVIPRGMHPITYVQNQITRVLETTTAASYCALVIVDHCETLIGRLRGVVDKRMSRWEIPDMLSEDIRDILATPLNTPCWVVHQMSGQANEKGPKAKHSHTDAKGSKSWGTYFHECFEVGQVDRSNNTCLFMMTKKRHGAILPPKLLKLTGNIGLLQDMPGDQPWPEDKPSRQQKQPNLKDEMKTIKKDT